MYKLGMTWPMFLCYAKKYSTKGQAILPIPHSLYVILVDVVKMSGILNFLFQPYVCLAEIVSFDKIKINKLIFSKRKWHLKCTQQTVNYCCALQISSVNVDNCKEILYENTKSILLQRKITLNFVERYCILQLPNSRHPAIAICPWPCWDRNQTI